MAMIRTGSVMNSKISCMIINKYISLWSEKSSVPVSQVTYSSEYYNVFF